MAYQGRYGSDGDDPRFEREGGRGGESPSERGEKGRFAKGTSGNPKGRPKKKKLVMPDDDTMPAVMLMALLKQMTVTENGKPKTINGMELLATKLLGDIAHGTAHFRLQFFKAIHSMGFANAFSQTQQLIAKLQELNEPKSEWTAEMEAEYQIAIPAYEEQWRLDELHAAFAEARREEFEQFIAAREEADRPMPDGLDS